LLLVKPEEPENIEKIKVTIRTVQEPKRKLTRFIDYPSDMNDLLEPFEDLPQPVQLKRIRIVIVKRLVNGCNKKRVGYE